MSRSIRIPSPVWDEERSETLRLRHSAERQAMVTVRQAVCQGNPSLADEVSFTRPGCIQSRRVKARRAIKRGDGQVPAWMRARRIREE